MSAFDSGFAIYIVSQTLSNQAGAQWKKYHATRDPNAGDFIEARLFVKPSAVTELSVPLFVGDKSYTITGYGDCSTFSSIVHRLALRKDRVVVDFESHENGETVQMAVVSNDGNNTRSAMFERAGAGEWKITGDWH